MRLKDLRDEQELLSRVLRERPCSEVLLPNGDDASVVSTAGGDLVAVSTDVFVEEVHFSMRYFAPYDVGIKVVEATASDIVAVGGHPRFILINLQVDRERSVEEVEGVYAGIRDACERIGATVLGGDTTSGSAQLTLGLTCIGYVGDTHSIKRRSSARPGQVVCLSGEVGSSHAGLLVCQRGLEGFDTVRSAHLRPRCRLDLVAPLSRVAEGMIDVSDGVASELAHLARESRCGFRINQSALPLLEETRAVASELGDDPYDYAWYGGEDFQLLFTASREAILPPGSVVIGEVTEDGEIRVDRGEGWELLVKGGYDHLA